jgi:hypothetical protein
LVEVELRREVRKVEMMSSMSDVRSPFQSSHYGLGSSIGRLYRIYDDKRCVRRWRRHWEKSLSFVCSSVMEVEREVRLSLTLTAMTHDTGGEELCCKRGRADGLIQ